MLHAECKDKTVIIRGPRIPFKTKLFSKSLTVLEKLVHELESLLLIVDYSEKLEEKDRGIETASGVYFKLENSMRKAFAALSGIYQIEDEQKYPMFKVEEENIPTEINFYRGVAAEEEG